MNILPATFAGRLAGLLAATALWLTAPPPISAAVPHPDFEVEVQGEGRPVIFIPGLATPGVIWQPVVEALHGAYQCHVLSLAGFGQVKPTGTNPFLPRVRDELIAYIRDLKLDHPVIVGHSLGGFLALSIAENVPDLPGGLVIVDALPFLPAIMNPAATPETVKAQVAPMIAQMSNATPQAFADIEHEAISAMVTSPANVEKVVGLTRDSDPKTTGRALNELMTTDLRPNLSKIICPVLVLAALADKITYAPRDAVMANYRKQYDGLAKVRFVGIDSARHFIMVDDLPGFMKVLEPELTPAPPEAAKPPVP